MRNLNKYEVEFSVLVESEDLPVRGNYMSTDDNEADKAAEDEILERLKRDDIYAWCMIRVTAKWEEFEGFATLGCCSYSENEDGEAQAKIAAEEHGMFDEALDDLMKNIRGYVMNASDIKNKLAD